MSGTALYRALVSAGAPEDQAQEAAGAVDDQLKEINEKLVRLDILSKISTALILAVLIKSFF